jgi:hypothetical protein
VGEYRLTIAQSEVEASLPTYSGGTERKGTPIITVPHGWGFRWTFQGAAFKLALYDKDRRMIGEEIKNVGGGSGERFVGKPGEYFFMIKSTGNYKIELFQR